MSDTPTTGLVRRTWRYGETKAVVVVDQKHVDGVDILTVSERNGSELFILVQAPGAHFASGVVGWIEFIQGGPTGGYWRFEANP